MVNLTKPRKVNESKSQLKRAAKSTGRLEVGSSFSEILLTFETTVCSDGKVRQSDNQIVSNAVRQLLSSLQSLIKRKAENKATWTEEQFELITGLAAKCLNELNRLVSEESAFPESVTLSALCIAFLLVNYFSHFASKFAPETAASSPAILASCQVYFSLFGEATVQQFDRSHLVIMFETSRREDSIQLVHSAISAKIKEMQGARLCFREVALLSGFLNCSAMFDLFTRHMIDVFLRLHPVLIRLCSMAMIHEFHVLRLLNQYLKAVLEHSQAIREHCCQANDSYEQLLFSLVTDTLCQIDNNWESPITGVGNSVKQAYRHLIELCRGSLRESPQLRQFVVEQFKGTLSLPFTCRSKYKKLSTLIQTLATEDIDTSQIECCKSAQPAGNVKLCELPFYFGENNFAQQVIHHLSINPLANSIAEFYKSSVTAIRDTYQNEADKVTLVWSTHWLEAITHIFSADSALANSTVVQNTLLAHIFPFTLQNVPNSMSILMAAFSQCSYGQISVVRIFLEKNSLLTAEKLLPPRSWLLAMLVDGDDMTRAEALALLVDEKFIHRNRVLVCRLVLCFVRTNLNIDNASFRQRIICKLEQFFSKVIISICDRHNAETSLHQLKDSDRQVLNFVKDTLDVLALSFLPGSSFQRKFTSFSIFSSILALLEKEDGKGAFLNLLRQLTTTESPVPWQQLIMLGLVDKDDKIRRLATEVLIQFSKSYLTQCSSLVLDSAHFDATYILAEKLLCSPRHQESHIGGLLLKWLLRCHISEVTPYKCDTNPGLSMITSLINKASAFYTNEFRNNLLTSSKCDPLHGYFLALNHSLTFVSFFDGVLCPKGADSGAFDAILFDGTLRDQVFQPCIQLSLDCLDFFLKLLTPTSTSECSMEEPAEDDELDMCSPSFHEMCQSIEAIIRKDSAQFSDENSDVFLSNDFQMILSMCWLNIKENCFLLTTLTSLFADIISLVHENDSLCTRLAAVDGDLYLMSADELLQIGLKIVSVMLRCRHRGVIEASGVSLTKFTRTMLRIQCYLNSSKQINSQMKAAFRRSLESFVTEILAIIDFRQASGSSVTRRSAGLALIIQAILVGEAEAIYLDSIRPIQEGVQESATLYDRVICLLVSIASSAITEESTADEYQFVDLPQSNAMHVLHSIIGTSALSHLSSKTVEQLFPLCIRGFTSSLWQIRNASLQLFGACIMRMLGPKKRAKSQNTDLGTEFGTTITFDEFAARYPSLLGVICRQFADCTASAGQLHPELVPVLSLLASFTALGQTESQVNSSAHQLVHFLLNFLSNPIWKVRMLAARSLASLWPLHQLEHFVSELSGKSPNQLNNNLLHGLLCCVSNLFELRALAISPEDMAQYRVKFQSMFAGHLKNRCSIITNIGAAIFQPNRASFDDDPQNENENESACGTSTEAEAIPQPPTQTLSSQQLTQIQGNVNFKKSDDIRYQAAHDLRCIIEAMDTAQLVRAICQDNLPIFVDILLTLLEDEDREVRLLGQRIVSHLYRNSANGAHCSNDLLSQAVAIDCFFSWLSLHFSGDRHLAEYLIRRLCASSNLSQYPALFRRQRIYDQHCEFILFEREEKNVFAEPYLMAIRIAAFLRSTMTSHSNVHLLLNSIRPEITAQCELLQMIISQLNGARLDSLMFLSIWKLADFFHRLVSLFAVLSLMEEEHQPSDSSPPSITQSTWHQLRGAFPFIVPLQAFLQSAGGDLLSTAQLVEM